MHSKTIGYERTGCGHLNYPCSVHCLPRCSNGFAPLPITLAFHDYVNRIVPSSPVAHASLRRHSSTTRCISGYSVFCMLNSAFPKSGGTAQKQHIFAPCIHDALNPWEPRSARLNFPLFNRIQANPSPSNLIVPDQSQSNPIQPCNAVTMQRFNETIHCILERFESLGTRHPFFFTSLGASNPCESRSACFSVPLFKRSKANQGKSIF